MKEILFSYLRNLLATTITAVFAIGKLPFLFTANDWLVVANTIWISCIPVLIRILDSKDTLGNNKKS